VNVPGHDIIVSNRRLIDLKAAIARARSHRAFDLSHCVGRKRHEAACDREVLTDDLDRLHPGDRERHTWYAHGVMQRLRGREVDVAGVERVTRAAERLHAQYRDAALDGFGEDELRETAEIARRMGSAAFERNRTDNRAAAF
jgi:hypothetical protein